MHDRESRTVIPIDVELARPPREVPHHRVYTSLLLGFAAAGLVLAFVGLTVDVLEGDTRTFDAYLAHAAQALRRSHPWLGEIMRDLSGLGSTVVLTLFVALTSGYLLVAGRRPTALLVALSSILGALAVAVLKVMFGRPRPDAGLVEVVASGLSFPSGHATMAAVVFLTLGALVSSTRGVWRERGYILLAAAVLTLAVGLSRVVLGVHWATDVVGGWAFGSAWAVLWLLVARRLAHHG